MHCGNTHNVRGFFRRPAERERRCRSRAPLAGWRKDPVGLNRVPQMLLPMELLSQRGCGWQTTQRCPARSGRIADAPARLAAGADGNRVRVRTHGCVPTGVVVRTSASRERQRGLAHEVSHGRGARISTRRMGAPQMGHGGSGRSVFRSSGASRWGAGSGPAIGGCGGSGVGTPSNSRQRRSFCSR